MFAVLLPAAGRSLRYSANGRGSKLAEPLGEMSVVARAVAAFVHRSDVALVVLATQDEANLRELLGSLPQDKLRFAPGGPSRADSVYNALLKVPLSIPYIAIHDAARPLVSQGLIDRVFATVRETNIAAGPACPVHLTIKQASGPLPATVTRTIPRHTLWAMQTPQAARRTDLLHAYSRCPVPLDQVTDDLQLLELAGMPATLVEGEESNLKITHPPDLDLARRHLGLPTQ